jgi:hypothetical protein
MNSAQDAQKQNIPTTSNTNPNNKLSNSGAAISSGSKEHAPLGGSAEYVSGAPQEIEIPKELKEIGVEDISGTIELPPEIKKLGVTAVNQSQPIAPSDSSLPKVALPISDDAVVKGTHAGVGEAFAWLAVWCMKRLRKAHVLLKVVHGKIVRVKG